MRLLRRTAAAPRRARASSAPAPAVVETAVGAVSGEPDAVPASAKLPTVSGARPAAGPRTGGGLRGSPAAGGGLGAVAARLAGAGVSGARQFVAVRLLDPHPVGAERGAPRSHGGLRVLVQREHPGVDVGVPGVYVRFAEHGAAGERAGPLCGVAGLVVAGGDVHHLPPIAPVRPGDGPQGGLLAV
ncbi:hypothetical protein [Streptomyces anulatus]|uniref:hypothetical protein n=1 Tax=Streptomyces anulatus TaxID=1892 RepID=UPI001B806C2C